MSIWDFLYNIYTIVIVIGLATLLSLLELRKNIRKPKIHMSLGRAKLSIRDNTKSVKISLLLANVWNKNSFFGDFAKQISVNLLVHEPINEGEIVQISTGLPFLKEVGAETYSSNEIQSEKDIIEQLEATYFQRSKNEIPQGRGETLVVAYGIEFGNKLFFASNPPMEIPLPKNDEKQWHMRLKPFNLEVAGENLASLQMDGNQIMFEGWDKWSYMNSEEIIHTPSKFQNFLIQLGFKKKIKLLK